MNGERSQQCVLAPSPHRRAHAEEWLGRVLKTWGVRSVLTGRWLSPAEPALDSRDEVVLSASYDEDLSLLTVEVSSGGRLLFGVDDWVG